MKKKVLSRVCLLVLLAFIMTACSSVNPSMQSQNPVESATPTVTSDPQTSTPSPSSAPSATATPEPTPTPTPTPAPDESVKVKAVYVSGSSAGSQAKLDKLIDLVNKTELNSFVIDIKEGGIINYDSKVPLADELGLDSKEYKVEEVLKKCHDNNIHVIGRIVVFRDNKLATKKAEFAIKRPNGKNWTEGEHGAWANPYLTGVQDYNIELAKEAVVLGFDEIQFDYVRFPTAKASEVNYGENVPGKSEAISNFLKRAAEEIKKVKDVPVSADIFAIVIESDRDGKAIGQNFDLVGKDIDYISPMIYPSHYANDSKGVMGNGVGQRINGVLFTAPDLKPYDVVFQALLKTKTRISSIPGYKAKVRPYIQDFTAKYLPENYWQTYGPDQVRDEIKAVYDAGYEEWILWNSGNNYNAGALLADGE